MQVDMLVRGGDVLTMDPVRTRLVDAAVAVADGAIVAVSGWSELRAAHPDATVVGDADALVTPGYVNAHQHVTGDRLVQSCIPDAIDSQAAIFDWAVPIHGAHTGDDDELSASLAAAEALVNGVTCTIEAGTVAHPDRVIGALLSAGMRARVGRWGWDVDGAPFAAPTDEVLDRARELLDSMPVGGLVEAGVTLVGHDLMSDELLVGASDLARRRGVGLTFHVSPHAGDPVSYLARTGVRPVEHFDRLGALGPHVLLAHAVHLDEAEMQVVLDREVGVASCPWAYLRLAQGFVGHHRHDWLYAQGGRLALGCDAENAGDAVDILRTATLFVGLVRDRSMDAFSMTADDALALATCRGAEAVGWGERTGSIEVGKRADLVVHDRTGPAFTPRSDDPVLQLVWGSDGRSVRDVVVDGRVVVEDGVCTSVDVAGRRAEAEARRRSLLSRRG
ncbi:MAG TPA: amidohydrolase family protein [Ilumatobacter sp.]|nr:amidohydrolase family protein [Ilumatobacter sp.]